MKKQYNWKGIYDGLLYLSYSIFLIYCLFFYVYLASSLDTGLVFKIFFTFSLLAVIDMMVNIKVKVFRRIK